MPSPARSSRRHSKTVPFPDRRGGVWSGSINAGFSGAKGKTDFDRMNFSLQGRFENDDGKETKNKIIGKAGLERDINDRNDRLFAYTNLTMERDKSEYLDLRSNLTGGLGYFLIKKDDRELKPRLGEGYEVSAFENSSPTKEIVGSAGYNYKLDMFEKLGFSHSFTYYPTFEEPGSDYRLDSDAGLSYPLNDNKSWHMELSLQHQYDSTPAADVKKLDT